VNWLEILILPSFLDALSRWNVSKDAEKTRGLKAEEEEDEEAERADKLPCTKHQPCKVCSYFGMRRVSSQRASCREKTACYFLGVFWQTQRSVLIGAVVPHGAVYSGTKVPVDANTRSLAVERGRAELGQCAQPLPVASFGFKLPNGQ
jgi:hypothetical protein